MAVTEEETTIPVRTWHSVYTKCDSMASYPATVDLMAMLVNFIQPQVVVEAGTYKGHLTLAVANILRQLEKGLIYTADVVDNFTYILPHVEELVPWIRFHRGDFLEMLNNISEPIDLAYIDASSDTNPRLRVEHAEAAYERLRPGGLIVADDTASKEWKEAQWFREQGIYLSQYRGLSIIQRRDA